MWEWRQRTDLGSRNKSSEQDPHILAISIQSIARNLWKKLGQTLHGYDGDLRAQIMNIVC